MQDTSFTDSFNQLEASFNTRYIILLYQLTDIVDPEKNLSVDPSLVFSEEDKEQLEILQASCVRWRDDIQADSMRTDACEFVYHVVGDHVNLLQARDERLFADDSLRKPSQDFFSGFFDTPGVKTMYLYSQLCDSVESDDKGNLWEAVLSLYRLAVLVYIFKQTPVVRDIISILFQNNPDMTTTNVFETVVKEFKKKKELRLIIGDIIKNNSEEKFTEIIGNLQKVVATFGTPPPTADREKAQAERLENCLILSELQHLDTEARAKIGGILGAERGAHVDAATVTNPEYEAVAQAQVDAGMGLADQFVHLRRCYLSKMMERPTEGNPDELMEALQSGDSDKAFKQMLKSTGPMLNCSEETIQSLKDELLTMDEELRGMDYEDDELCGRSLENEGHE